MFLSAMVVLQVAAVGFSADTLHDLSRPFPGHPGRPVQLFTWYSAASPGKCMTLGDYIVTAESSTALVPPSANRKREVMASWSADFAEIAGTATTASEVFDKCLTARANARPVHEKRPIAVYVSGAGGNAFENVLLAELLAARGFVVVAIPSHGVASASSEITPDGLEAATRDLEVAVAHAVKDYDGDPSRIVALGYSWGGLAAMAAASRNENIRGVVSLDGSIASHEEKARSLPGWGAWKLRASHLFVTTNETDAAVRAFVERAHFFDARIVVASNATHGDFTAYQALASRSGTPLDSAHRRKAQQHVELIEYIARFVAAAAGITPFPSDVALGGSPIDLRRARPAPPWPTQFLRIVDSVGSKEARIIFERTRQTEPDYPLFDGWEMTNAAYRLVRRGKIEDGLDAMRMVVEAAPAAYKSRGYLASLNEEAGNSFEAFELFNQALGMALRELTSPAVSEDIDWYRTRLVELRQKFMAKR